MVDDCSTDGTKDKLKRWKNKVKIYYHLKNRGKGAAIRYGLSQATGQVILIQDADLEYNPSDYTKLLAKWNKKSPVVYGSRLMNYQVRWWGKNRTPLLSHYIANKSLTFLTNLLYGAKLSDIETGYKLVHRKLMLSLNLKANRFEIEPEITAKILKRQIHITEVPIQVTPRSYKEGKKIIGKTD